MSALEPLGETIRALPLRCAEVVITASGCISPAGKSWDRSRDAGAEFGDDKRLRERERNTRGTKRTQKAQEMGSEIDCLCLLCSALCLLCSFLSLCKARPRFPAHHSRRFEIDELA